MFHNHLLLTPIGFSFAELMQQALANNQGTDHYVLEGRGVGQLPPKNPAQQNQPKKIVQGQPWDKKSSKVLF